MTGHQYIMIDAPSMSGGKFDLPSCHDVTTFDAYDFCISDKDIIAIVHWKLVRHYYQQATPSASLLDGSAWWDRLYLGRKVLTKQGYSADLYLPLACM
jgi:hypothetical protein